MPFEQWLLLLATCALGAMSPGPSLICVLQNAIAGGFRLGVKVSVAHASGVALWACATILGIASISKTFPFLHNTLILLGALYLIYMGLRSFASGLSGVELSINGVESPKGRQAVRDGFFIAFLNPKLAVFFVALFSQFVDANNSPIDSLVMVSTAAFVDALWYILVTFIASLSNFRNRLLRRIRYIDCFGGIVFIFVGVSVAVSWIK
ncbi:MAG: LysE family translocator [Oleiphilaceae bacterium]|nr:LysE family translocator [Oleiphilaceae bacterium]